MQDAPAFTAVLFGLRGCLVQASADGALPASGALDSLHRLRAQQVPCIWLDDVSAAQGKRLSGVLPDWLPGHCVNGSKWPTPTLAGRR